MSSRYRINVMGTSVMVDCLLWECFREYCRIEKKQLSDELKYIWQEWNQEDWVDSKERTQYKTFTAYFTRYIIQHVVQDKYTNNLNLNLFL